MKVEPKRAKKCSNPLLIIGLGGTGTDALLTIKEKFNRRFIPAKAPNGDVLDVPECTAYLAFDKDTMDLVNKRIEDISLDPDERFELVLPKYRDIESLPDHIRQWFDTRLIGYDTRLIGYVSVSPYGVGGIRQIGRYALFHHANDIVAKLQTTIQGLIAMGAAGTMTTLEIVLTTGISGGTGSGTFLDMAFLIRYVMNTYFHGISMNLMAYIILPEVIIDKFPNIALSACQRLRANSFAALKELDFWMNYDIHQYDFVQKYSETVTQKWGKPFDNVVLISDTKRDGTRIRDPYASCLDILSESVLSFYADDESHGDNSISWHWIAGFALKMQYLCTPFPVNYAYMSIGAAVCTAQRDEMITYQAERVLDRIPYLKEVSGARNPEGSGMLNDRAGEDFISEFMPDGTDHYGNYAAILPEPSFLSDSAITPRDIHDGRFFHLDDLIGWKETCRLNVREYAAEEKERLSKLFRELVTKYLTDLRYGPFSLGEFLRDTENGFVGYMERLVRFWQGEAERKTAEALDLYNNINDNLYPAMLNMNKFAMMAGLWSPVFRYREQCVHLFRVIREAALAENMRDELKELRNIIYTYSYEILPAFCDILLRIKEDLSSGVREQRTGGECLNMVDLNDLKIHVDIAFDDPAVERVTVRVLEAMSALSLDIQPNHVGALPDIAEIRERLESLLESSVRTAAASVNDDSMDTLLDIILPGASEPVKLEYLTEHVFMNLQQAAQTMLPMGQEGKEGEDFIPYTYASAPRNAQIIRAGIEDFQKGNHVTIKASDVTDRIYWLNTFNKVPMYLYRDLRMLEAAYENAMTVTHAHGLHLVYTANPNVEHELYNDWSLLPSPVLHELRNIAKPETVAEREKQIADMLDKALENGSAQIVASPGQNLLKIRIREKDGRPENLEQFRESLSAVLGPKSEIVSDEAFQVWLNGATDAELETRKAELQQQVDALEAKVAQLAELGNRGTERAFSYKDYTQKYADAHGLNLETPHNTAEENAAVEANRSACRRMAAAYVLYAWHPQQAEQMLQQQAMYEELAAAKKAVDADKQLLTERITKINNIYIDGKIIYQTMQTAAADVALLHLMGAFVYARGGKLNFKDAIGEERPLMSGAFNEDEMVLYAQCKPLAILRVLGNPKDGRIDPMDRAFLMDKAKDYRESLDSISDAEYEQLCAAARKFEQDNQATANGIKYARCNMTPGERKNNIALLDKMLLYTSTTLI